MEADYDMVSEWSKWHGRNAPPKEILPPIGVVVMEGQAAIAALWMYIAQGVPVCFVEYAITAPKLSAQRSSRALLLAVSHFRALAAQMGFSLLVCYTLPAVARFLAKSSWRSFRSGLVGMAANAGGETS